MFNTLVERNRMQIKCKSKINITGVTRRTATIILAFTFIISVASAQESLNASGGRASGMGGTVCYSVGQIAGQTPVGTYGSLAEGVQQPYEISIITAVEDAKGINFSILAYPNPTADILRVSIDSKHLKGLSFRLVDTKGKILQSAVITSNHTDIILTDLAASIYFVKVIDNEKEIKTFKIIKY